MDDSLPSGTLPVVTTPTYSRIVDSALLGLTDGAVFYDEACENALVEYLVKCRNDASESAGYKRPRDDKCGSEHSQEVFAPTVAKRTNLRTYSDEVYAVLKGWIHEHREDPYPTEAEKYVLMVQTGLRIEQINNWMSNTRRRVLK